MRNTTKCSQRHTIKCRECMEILTQFGVQSSLLSDPKIFLLSTNIISNRIRSVYAPYNARSCKCVVRDVGCKNCGKIVGYHIIQPCNRCLKAQNNGHLWMFHFESVVTDTEKMALSEGK